MLAAVDAGIALDCVALVPNAGEDPAGVAAALLDGMTYVVVGPDARLAASERRRLLARARERGSGFVSVAPWEQAAVRLDVVAHRWAGADSGAGYLRRCELDVTPPPTGSPTDGRSPCPCREARSSTPSRARRARRRRRAAQRCASSGEAPQLGARGRGQRLL